MKDLVTNYEHAILDSFKIGRNRSEYYYYLMKGRVPDTIYRAFVDQDFWETELELLQKKFSVDNSVSEELYDCEKKCYELKRVFFPEPGIMFVYDNQQLNEKLIIHYDRKSDMEIVNSIKQKLQSYCPVNRYNEIGYLVSNSVGLNVMLGSFKPYKDDYSSFLGTEVNEFKNRLIEDVAKHDSTGLYLIHGEPGTGKTSFIKSILGTSNRLPIYIPMNCVEQLSSPALIGQLMRHPNSILILEDADTALMKRSGDNTSAVSTLLNLTDGFMADFLSPIVICTFNTRLSEIDSALLRKGRLNGICEFKPLNSDSANDLSEFIGFDRSFNSPTPLADVINQNTQSTFSIETIGF